METNIEQEKRLLQGTISSIYIMDCMVNAMVDRISKSVSNLTAAQIRNAILMIADHSSTIRGIKDDVVFDTKRIAEREMAECEEIKEAKKKPEKKPEKKAEKIDTRFTSTIKDAKGIINPTSAIKDAKDIITPDNDLRTDIYKRYREVTAELTKKGYAYHHSAVQSTSINPNEPIGGAVEYAGKFGVGYKVFTGDRTSYNNTRIEYWIAK